jgi:large exoprotein involved in heme utilization and adhesion
VNANQVQVNSGALINAATTGPGPGGSININAGSTFSSNAGTVSSTATQAAGGNINISAGNSVTLANGARISASSTGQGSAGDVQINAGQSFTATNSAVTTEASQSTGGVIKITTLPGGAVQLTDSTISASALDGSGGGGSVNIDPQYVVLQNSQILANSVFGPGGNISITTNLLMPDSTSLISASSQFGQQGTINIQSPVSPASGKIIPLGQKPLIATSLLSQRCAALAGGNISSFTVAGRDSLPAEPGGWVSSPLALIMSEPEDGKATQADGAIADRVPLLSLRKIAPSGFLTQGFALDSSDCQS